jgi:chromosomal replication initiator protein
VRLIWEEFLKIIKEEAGSQIVETWFKAVVLEEWNPTTATVTLRVPNQFVSKWIQEHYTTLLKTHLARLLHSNNIRLFFISNSSSTPTRSIIPASVAQTNIVPQTSHTHFTATHDAEKKPAQNNYPLSKPSAGTSLTVSKKKGRDLNAPNINENYHFENFVVGPNNSLAHAAAHAVAQNTGAVYNPLFIYGGTGLGKTHLLHAIGNEAKKRNPQLVIRYETCDHFINEFIHSIRLERSSQFREKYQKVDLLMLDDIQFLSNKEQTQESFFHIFNALYEQQKQIVLSSDTFPKEITGLQNRLKSRMEWGLVADIQIPDLETKIAILERKAEAHGIALAPEVADFIASRVISNIRELEGALIRVSAFATLTNQPISIEMAKRVLLNLNEKRKDSVQLENVLKAVSKHYEVSIHEIKSKKRQKDITFVRQVTLYLMKKLTISSLQTIGSFIGGRDHSTVIHAITKVEGMMKDEKELAQKLRMIEQEILMS